MEDPEISPHSYSHLIFNKGEELAASAHGGGKIRYPHVEDRFLSLTLYKNQLKVDQRS
jgi:hypothetical protein